MKTRWLIACVGLLGLFGGVMVARTRTDQRVRTDVAAERSASDGLGGGLAADRADPGAPERRHGFRGFRPHLRARGAGAASDRELAAMSAAIEASRTARTEAQRLAAEELGLDAPTRSAVAAIFDEERHAVTRLAETPEVTDDAAHANLIEQRKHRLAELLGDERAEEFHQAYTQYWLELLSAVYR